VLGAVFVHGHDEKLVCLVRPYIRKSSYVLRHVGRRPTQMRLKEPARGQTHPDHYIVPLLEPESTSLRDKGRVVSLRRRRSQTHKYGAHDGAADRHHKLSHPGFSPCEALDGQFGHRYMNASWLTVAETNVAS
jgi:hypothetical protein